MSYEPPPPPIQGRPSAGQPPPPRPRPPEPAPPPEAAAEDSPNRHPLARPAPPLRKAIDSDLSQTDWRIVGAFACMAMGLMLWWTCFLIAPVIPAAGIVLAIFAPPSRLRITALVGNVVVFLLANWWLFLLAMAVMREGLL